MSKRPRFPGKNKRVSGSQFTSLQEPLQVKLKGEVTRARPGRSGLTTNGTGQDVCNLAHCRDRPEEGCSVIPASAPLEDSVL